MLGAEVECLTVSSIVVHQNLSEPVESTSHSEVPVNPLGYLHFLLFLGKKHDPHIGLPNINDLVRKKLANRNVKFSLPPEWAFAVNEFFRHR